MSTYEPSLFDLEDRGYNRGTGHIVLPSGQLIAVSQEADGDEFAAVLFRDVLSLYLCDVEA